ncbi:hypothetical protein [Paramesorhizobium deserti]|nr:hypothetical protein [Paramesorhizobium deserti]
MQALSLYHTAGIAPAYLSQIETVRREGALETMRKIALNITLDDLVG